MSTCLISKVAFQLAHSHVIDFGGGARVLPIFPDTNVFGSDPHTCSAKCSLALDRVCHPSFCATALNLVPMPTHLHFEKICKAPRVHTVSSACQAERLDAHTGCHAGVRSISDGRRSFREAKCSAICARSSPLTRSRSRVDRNGMRSRFKSGIIVLAIVRIQGA